MTEIELQRVVQEVVRVLEERGYVARKADLAPPPRRAVEVTIGTAGKVFGQPLVRVPKEDPDAALGNASRGQAGPEDVIGAEPEHTRSPDCPQCSAPRRCSESDLRALGADRIAVCRPSQDCSSVAKLVDHTLLKPSATQEEVAKLCQEAKTFCFASVCINPSYVPLAANLLRGSGVKVCTVVGFPLGSTTPMVKALEARDAIANGADEVDMVINVGAIKSGNAALALEDIRAVREATRGRVLKVILETAYLTKEEKVQACRLAKEAGADFVKTSTGFGPGGATVEDIELMRQTVGPRMGVKAAGGIRDEATARAMIQAGATRLGTSASVAIVTGQKAEGKY